MIFSESLNSADGYAVKELLKLINSLVETSSAIHNQDDLGKLSEPSLKAAGLRDLRERVMQITRTGKCSY